MEKEVVDRGKKKKPHAVIIPFPHQGHINPMFKVAKILHGKGFHITFVNTEYSDKRLVSDSHRRQLPRGFKFAAIPSTDFDIIGSHDHVKMVSDIRTKFFHPVMELVKELMDQSGASNQDHDEDEVVPPPVSCMVSDPTMIFTMDVSKELDIPLLLLHVYAGSTLVTVPHVPKLLQNGILPLKGDDQKGYLDTVIDGIQGINGTMRLKHLAKFFRVKDPNYAPFLFLMEMFDKSRDKNLSIGAIVNTFDELEPEAVLQLSSIFPQVFAIGPFHQLVNEIPSEFDSQIELNFVQEEDLSCLAWLDSKPPESVLLVSFGTTGFLKPKQLEEFAWGLADSQESFLWVIRSDLIIGEESGSNCSNQTPWSAEYESAIKDRGFIVSWCPQVRVLRHPAIGGYLTHCGWNSLLESVTAGVPMLCWPSFADQTTNSWVCCNQWGIGVEIGNDVRREEIVRVVRELIRGEKGKEMKKKAMEWKKKAEEACRGPNGSSFKGLQKMVNLLTSSDSRD